MKRFFETPQHQFIAPQQIHMSYIYDAICLICLVIFFLRDRKFHFRSKAVVIKIYESDDASYIIGHAFGFFKISR